MSPQFKILGKYSDEYKCVEALSSHFKVSEKKINLVRVVGFLSPCETTLLVCHIYMVAVKEISRAVSRFLPFPSEKTHSEKRRRNKNGEMELNK